MNVMTGNITTDGASGTDCPSDQIFLLAEKYRKAAHILFAHDSRGDRLSRAPAHLNAIHAIELYLNGLLLSHGHEASEIRALQHDLAARTALAVKAGLVLREKTAAHLTAMTGSREYLITRYHPDMADGVSEVTRLKATLDEVAKKVSKSIGCGNTQSKVAS